MGAHPWLLRGAVLGVALVVGLVTWIVAGGDDETFGPPFGGAIRIVTEEDLAGFAAEAGHPVYWAGERPGADLTSIDNGPGGIEVRYVAEGAVPGSEPVAFPTVLTYPLSDPQAALDAFAAGPGSIVRRSDDGRKVVGSAETPTSAYFVSPDNSVQVEVYDPAPGRALAVALGPRVRPAGSGPAER